MKIFCLFRHYKAQLSFWICILLQPVDLPPIASENFDKGILNNANVILVIVEKTNEIKPILDSIKLNKKSKKIIVFNKIDVHEEKIKRKISETLKSKKYNFVLTSTKTNEGLEDLKEEIFKAFEMIRIYTKHSGERHDDIPVVLHPNATLGEVAEKILHGYSKKVRYAKIWGPSSKFAGQKIGLKHVVKDKDIVEFVTD